MKVKKLFVVLALVMLVFSIGLATASATSVIKTEKKDSGLTIESKGKVASYKVTWNANGGKIGTKKTKVTMVKKGSKIGKLASPKRSGYTFKGWYTKKSGGKKITKNTKPTKRVTYYAQWKKGTQSSSQGNTFQLKIWQGYDFKNKRVIDYGNKPDLVDMQFYFQQRPNGIYVYLGASKIHEFNSSPTNLKASQVEQWDDYTWAPSPGKYYAIRARDGSHYILHLLKYENQGKAHTYWKMTFDWKKISVSK
ncbi:MAG: InlB B-repeat-containing protein [Methanobrevibacter sp.]|nr:InlB B-repeat-containing protein [Methanobrevibacter sp.]